MAFLMNRLVIVAAVVSCASCAADPPSYPDALRSARDEKDRMLRESQDSPVPAAHRASFPALQYYPPDESYRVPAALEPPRKDAGEVIVMPTSTGQQRPMRRAGTLQFSVKGQPLQLSAFSDLESAVPNRLFVPFGDLTNGKGTYPGGRYLDLDPTATGLYEVDFNRAYSPYCAYNPEYDCPFPPPENRLKVEIRAGEKYQASQTLPLNPEPGTQDPEP